MYADDSVERRKAVLVKLIEKFFACGAEVYPLVPLMGIVRNKLQQQRRRAHLRSAAPHRTRDRPARSPRVVCETAA